MRDASHESANIDLFDECPMVGEGISDQERRRKMAVSSSGQQHGQSNSP